MSTTGQIQGEDLQCVEIKDGERTAHQRCRLATLAIVVVWLVFGAMVVVEVFYASVQGVFTNATSTTPLHGMLSMRSAITTRAILLVWQVFFLIYCTLSFLTKIRLLRFPLSVVPLYTVVCIANTAAILATQYDLLLWAIPAVIITPLVLSLCILLSILRKKEEVGVPQCPWTVVVIVCNALLVYFIYMSMASFYTVGIALVALNYSSHIAEIVLLAVFLVFIFVFFTLELTVLDKYFRYSNLHYQTLINTFVDFTAQRWDKTEPRTCLALAITCLIVFALLCKIGRMIFARCVERQRQKTQPLGPHSPNTFQNDGNVFRRY